MDSDTTGSLASGAALEARLYEQIGNELDAQNIDKGVWTKSFAEAMGDDAKTRALYIRRRFDQLMAAEAARGGATHQSDLAQLTEPPLAAKVAEAISAGSATVSTHRYHGVGGWLTFLIVQLVALSPIYGAYSAYFAIFRAEQTAPQILLNPQWVQFKTVCWLIFGIAALISVAGGLNLMTDFRGRSVRLAIGALWLKGPASAFAYLVAGVVILNFGANDTAGMAGVIFAEAIWAGIWTTYLLRSKRVRNTYLEAHDNERRPASKSAVILVAGIATVALGSVLYVYIKSAGPVYPASKSDAVAKSHSATPMAEPAALPATNQQNVATETKLGQAPDVIPFSAAPNAPPVTNQQNAATEMRHGGHANLASGMGLRYGISTQEYDLRHRRVALECAPPTTSQEFKMATDCMYRIMYGLSMEEFQRRDTRAELECPPSGGDPPGHNEKHNAHANCWGAIMYGLSIEDFQRRENRVELECPPSGGDPPGHFEKYHAHENCWNSIVYGVR